MTLPHHVTTARSVAEARSRMAEGWKGFALRASDVGFALTQTLMRAPEFSLRRWTFDGRGPIDIQATTGDEITVVWLSGGELQWSAAGWSSSTREPVLLPPSTALTARGTRLDANVLTLDRAQVSRLAADVYNTTAHSVRFVGSRPNSVFLGDHWIATVGTYRELFADTALWNNPDVRATALRHLAILTLETFRQTGDAAARAEGAVALSSGYHRALQFIDDHASLPISGHDIAAGAELTPLELRRAFDSHSTETPLQRLRTARLAAAHADLLLADTTDGDTVAAIARRWGFAYPGDFARRYRRQYGVTPKQSLDA